MAPIQNQLLHDLPSVVLILQEYLNLPDIGSFQALLKNQTEREVVKSGFEKKENDEKDKKISEEKVGSEKKEIFG